MMERLFHLRERGTTVRREVMGALTSFFSIAYIIFVTPDYLAMTGMDYTAVLIITCIVSALGCFAASLAGIPVMHAPGVGLNAFFTYTLCFTMGYSWQQSLAIVSLSGVLFLLLVVTPLRDKMVSCIPPSMKNAITAGIGMFIALIGLLNAGIIRADAGKLLLGINSRDSVLAVLGLLITGILMAWKIRGAMLIGIIVTTLLGFPMGVSHLPETMEVSFSSVMPLLFAADFKGIFALGILPLVSAVVTFTICICFDTLGCLICIAGEGEMLDEKGGIGRLSRGMITAAVCTAVSPLLGGPAIGAPVEGSTGVADGARTGLYSLVVGGLFLASTLLAPVAGMIPGAATAPILILIGMLMIHNATNIYWHNIEIALPCFLTMIMIPFTYSIADGIGMGFISYTAIEIAAGKAKKISPITYGLSIMFVVMYVLSAL